MSGGNYSRIDVRWTWGGDSTDFRVEELRLSGLLIPLDQDLSDPDTTAHLAEASFHSLMLEQRLSQTQRYRGNRLTSPARRIETPQILPSNPTPSYEHPLHSAQHRNIHLSVDESFTVGVSIVLGTTGR